MYRTYLESEKKKEKEKWNFRYISRPRLGNEDEVEEEQSWQIGEKISPFQSVERGKAQERVPLDVQVGRNERKNGEKAVTIEFA